MIGSARATLAQTAVALLVATTAGAQQWHTVDVSRQLRDSAPHRLHVEYGAGHLSLRPSNDAVLFAMRVRYNDENGAPVHQYNAGERSLRLGVNGQSIRVGKRVTDEASGEMTLSLSRSVPFDLQMDVGAARADVQLGGLMLTDARIHTGASDLTVGFDVPNISRMGSLTVDVGAANFVAKGLANANTSKVHVNGGVGDVSLSFDGTWTQNVALDAAVAVGKLTVRIPPDVGVRVEAKRFLASFDHGGLDKRADGMYYSSNWESARFHLEIKAETVLGAIEIDRTIR